jgi:hypothetical protein
VLEGLYCGPRPGPEDADRVGEHIDPQCRQARLEIGDTRSFIPRPERQLGTRSLFRDAGVQIATLRERALTQAR